MHVAALAALAGVGCGVPPNTSRLVSGQLAAGVYPLDNPIVLAQSTSLRTFFASVATSGLFRLPLEAGATYRLAIANNTRSGTYRVVSSIVWSTETGQARWAHMRPGAPISLATVRLISSSPNAPNGSGTGGGSQMGAAGGGQDRLDEHDDAVFCEVADGMQLPPSIGSGPLPAGLEGDDGAEGQLEAEGVMLANCDQRPPAPPVPPTGSPGPSGAPCTINADCAGSNCINSTCQPDQMGP